MTIKNPTKFEEGKTFVYFVRHGDRIFIPNSKDIGLNIPGPGLSKKGESQARFVAKELEKIKQEVDIIYTSGMDRAIETANIIQKKIGKNPKKAIELSEFSTVLWTGKFLNKNYWKSWSRLRKAKRIFNKILREHKGKSILIVAHGNIIKGLLGDKMNLGFKKRRKMDYDNCGVTKARFDVSKFDYLYYYNRKTL